MKNLVWGGGNVPAVTLEEEWFNFAVSAIEGVAVVNAGCYILMPCFNTYRIRVASSLIRPTGGPETIDLCSVGLSS